MLKAKVKVLVAAGATSLLIFVSMFLTIGSSHPEITIEVVDLGASVPSQFSITENPSTGYVTAENDNIKVVWHYKILRQEYNNRGGGNIYELYDKRSDPLMQRNLVARVDDGTAGTSPPKAGIGGLGATYLYEQGYNVAIGDNGGQSRLVSSSHRVDEEGNAVFAASFIIASKVVPSMDSYRVDKVWTVFPDGQIKLEIDMTILRSFAVSQIAYNFSFSQDYGWRDAVSKRHFWSVNTCSLDGVNNASNNDLYFSNIDRVVDRDNSLMHTQSFSLYGQDGGVAASVKMDNQGQGFENGGLFNLGAGLWGTTANPTSEYSNYSNRAYGHTMRFYAWWGGDPPQSDRYRYISAGTTWSDTLWIEMSDTSQRVRPRMTGSPETLDISETGATVEWETNVATNSRILYRPVGTGNYISIADNHWTPGHVIDITGLTPGVTYEYEVRSGDATGEATAGGTFTTIGVEGVGLVASRSAVQWISYQDYLDRILTVDFDVTNIGLDRAYYAEALLVFATSGVSGNIQNAMLGEIDSGNRKTLRIEYLVPMGVNIFQTSIYMRAEDANGQEHFFPGPPPAG